MIEEMADSLIEEMDETARNVADEPDVLYFARAARLSIRVAQIAASKRALGMAFLRRPGTFNGAIRVVYNAPRPILSLSSALAGGAFIYSPLDDWLVEWLVALFL